MLGNEAGYMFLIFWPYNFVAPRQFDRWCLQAVYGELSPEINKFELLKCHL